jgi:hypothetical protein
MIKIEKVDSAWKFNYTVYVLNSYLIINLLNNAKKKLQNRLCS